MFADVLLNTSVFPASVYDMREHHGFVDTALLTETRSTETAWYETVVSAYRL